MSRLIYNDKNARFDDSQADAMERASEGAPKSQFYPGDVIEERYIVRSVLGFGGFGCVYKVHQLLLNKDFALKTLNPVHVTETTVLRLRKEAQAASKLTHPNLVRAIDFGMISASQPFLVMELVEGRTLAEHLKEHGKLTVKTALQIFIPIAQALAYAHRQGIVHRDLKPSNVMLTTDTTKPGELIPKVVDFGIAKIQFDDASQALTLTSTGDVFGTPLYMSPEQCAGTAVDTRSDIYSFGCMLFEALTGAPPFQGRTALEVMMQHGAAPLPSLKEASLGEKFAPELETIVELLLAKQPQDRYPNAERVAEDLSYFDQGDFERLNSVARQGNLVSKQTIAKKSAIKMATTAAVCTIFGAIIGYGAALSKTPSASLNRQKASDASPYESATYGPIQLHYETGYFSHLKDDQKIFNFLTPKNHPFGALEWWDGNDLKSKPASLVQTFPKDARLILAAGPELLLAPHFLSQFQLNDLYGVVLDPYTCLIPLEQMSHAVRMLAEQDKLQIFEMADKDLNARSFRSIGDIPHLAWLDLMRIHIKDLKLTGAQVAELKNLQNLHVLRLDKVIEPTPALAKLASGSAIRRLCVAHTLLTAQDLKYIGQLQSLEILSLRGSDAMTGASNMLEEVGKLRRLKTLIIDASNLENSTPDALHKLRGLHIIAHRSNSELPGAKWKQALSSLKQCEVIEDNQQANVDCNYFSSLKSNPTSMEI